MERQREVGFQDVLDEKIARQEREFERQQVWYRVGRNLRPLDGYTVILVDDGIATGSTFIAFIHVDARMGSQPSG